MEGEHFKFKLSSNLNNKQISQMKTENYIYGVEKSIQFTKITFILSII